MAEPQVIVQSGDGIADDLLPLRQKEREVRENAFARLPLEIGFVGRAAPDVVAGIDRLDRRCDLRAHAGTDAVAADEDIGALATPAGEMRDDAGAVLLHALEGMAEVVMRRVDGLAQEPLQAVPGGEDLRQVFLCDHAPVAVESNALLDFDAEVARTGAARAKRVQQLRMGGDPGAAADQLDRRALINVCVPPLLPQERRSKQAGHRSADDDGATPARRGKRNRHLLDRTRQPSGNDTPPARASEGSSRLFRRRARAVFCSVDRKPLLLATFSPFEHSRVLVRRYLLDPLHSGFDPAEPPELRMREKPQLAG